MHKLAIFLVGLLVLLLPVSSIMSISNVMASYDYGYGTDQYMKYSNDMTNDNYYKSQNSELLKKIKCNNINANLNGVDVSLGDPTSNNVLTEAQAGDDGGLDTINAAAAATNGWGNSERNNNNGNDFRFVCVNNNDNENNVVVINETTPVPPTPPTGSITVNKEIFGCVDNDGNERTMDCFDLNDSPSWVPCTDATISNTPFCQNISPNLFDIELLGEIEQFEASTAGTTVQNLQPDSFRVNEIVHESSENQQLGVAPELDVICKFELGFDGGGALNNENTQTFYSICFEYEDEQGNDCNPITIGAEEKTCTVKNHIVSGFQNPPPG
jgi:hypothetical protein